MRWDRLFADLEGQLDAGQRAEVAAEAADLQRLETSRVLLADRLRAAAAVEVTLCVAGSTVTGRVLRVGPGWSLVATPGADVLVALDAVDWTRGLPAAAIPDDDRVVSGLGLAHVLRQLARDRAGVVIALRAGGTATGTIDRVGADHLDLAEHAADDVRRTAAVRRVRTVPFGAVATVRPA